MNFKLHHDVTKKTLSIPRAALQLSGLTDAEELTIHTEPGCVLLLRDDLTAAESLKTIQLLSELNVALICQLVQASQAAADMAGGAERDECDHGCCDGLSVPVELLEEAGIRLDGPLNINVEDGRLVITSSEPEQDDPLNDLESDFLTMLRHSGVSLNGLRYLLEDKGDRDE